LCQSVFCKGCESTGRDEKKGESLENRARQKVGDTIRRHAKRYNMKVKDFTETFGWDRKIMLDRLLQEYEGNCCSCNKPYAGMGHGLFDISLDIIDPREKPFLSNTRWMCLTENIRKGNLTPEQWGQDRVNWRQWEQNIEKRILNELHGLPLFAAK